MRFVVWLGLGLSLAACAGAPPSAETAAAGAWRIEQRHDPINGTTATAMVGKPVVDPKTLVFHKTLLQLMCFDGAPIVRFAFDFNVGAANSTTLSYRFDDNPPRPNIKSHLVGRDVKVVTIEDRAAVAQFAQELAAANVLHLQIASLTRGRLNIDYPVAGGAAAIEASYATCPVGSDNPRAKTAERRKR